MASTATTNGGRSILADAEDHIVMQALPSIENDQADSHIPDLTLTNQSAFVTTQEDIPPDGGYGWVCAVCVFFINAHTWGANSAWAVFLAHYLADSTFPGASRLEYALIGGLSISQCLLVSPVVSASNRKFGTRVTLLIGTLLMSLSLLGASFATQIWHLFLTQGIFFGYGMGFLYIPATAILPQWFGRRRSLAVGIASSGVGIGGLVYNLSSGAAVESLGLQWTYRLLAACTFVANLACSLLLKDRNRVVKPRERVFAYREYGHVEILLVVFWGFFSDFGYIILLYSLPNYANSIGLSAHQASVVGAVLNLGLAIGRPAVGYYSDTFGRINMAATMTALCGVLSLALWVPAKTYSVLLLFALMSGTVTGTFWSCVAPVTAEVVGLQRLPSAFSIICISLVLPTTFAEPIALQLISSSGYLASQIFVGCMFLGGAASAWALRSWKIYEIETKAERENEDLGMHGRMTTEAKCAPWLTPRRLFLTKRV